MASEGYQALKKALLEKNEVTFTRDHSMFRTLWRGALRLKAEGAVTIETEGEWFARTHAGGDLVRMPHRVKVVKA